MLLAFFHYLCYFLRIYINIKCIYICMCTVFCNVYTIHNTVLHKAIQCMSSMLCTGDT